MTLSQEVSLPVGAVTGKFGVFGVSGSGKTYTGSVLAEEVLLAGAPLVIADPLGVWYGLRIEGTKLLPPIYILGGEHADLPLSTTSGHSSAVAGAAIADLVLSERLSVILDMSELAPDEQPVFFAAFCRQLYEKSRTAVHLIVDECDIFAPEQPGSSAEWESRRALDTIIRRGRVRGIGATLITQRPAVVAKSLVSQIGTLIVHRLAAEQDRKAIDGWVKAHGTAEERKRVLESLAGLATGEAWFWSPESGLLERTRVRKRYSFDSSATPEVGVDTVLAEVTPLTSDALALLAERLAVQMEETDASDPVRLKAQITELRQKLADRPTTERIVEKPVTVEVEKIVEKKVTVEVPVVTPEDREHFERLYNALVETAQAERESAEMQRAAADSLIASAKDLLNLAGEIGKKLGKTSPGATHDVPEGNREEKAPVVPTGTTPVDETANEGEKIAHPPQVLAGQVPVSPASSLLPEAQRMLDALGSYPGGRMTSYQVSLVSGVSNPVFTDAAKELMAAGLMTSAPTAHQKRDHYTITDAGFVVLSEIKKRPMKRLEGTRAGVIDFWESRMKTNPTKVKAMLHFLLDQRPKSFTSSYLATRYKVKPGGTQIAAFVNTLDHLDLVFVGHDKLVTAMSDIP